MKAWSQLTRRSEAFAAFSVMVLGTSQRWVPALKALSLSAPEKRMSEGGPGSPH